MAPKLDLGRMVGPLPLGAWVGAVGGSLAIAGVVAYKRRQGGDRSSPAVIPGGAVPYPTLYAPLGEPSQQGPFGLAPAPGGPPGPPPIIDNVDWQRAAIVFLTANKNVSAYIAQQTLAKYLDGQLPLTPEEMAIVEMAIRGVGPPPQPPMMAPPPLPPKPPPGPAPVPPPAPAAPRPAPAPRQRIHVVRRGDTLWGLAQRYYGSGFGWRRIADANPWLPRPFTDRRGRIIVIIRPGQRLVIP